MAQLQQASVAFLWPQNVTTYLAWASSPSFVSSLIPPIQSFLGSALSMLGPGYSLLIIDHPYSDCPDPSEAIVHAQQPFNYAVQPSSASVSCTQCK